MKLSCPFCGQHLEIEEAGQYQCPACNNAFEVEIKIRRKPEAKIEKRCKRSDKIIKIIKMSLSCIISLSAIIIYVFLNSETMDNGTICFFSKSNEIIGINTIILVFVLVLFNGLLFVSKEKSKTVYAICPNPKCDFEGEIELKTAGEIAKETLLLHLFNVGVIYTDGLICPKCGSRIR